MAMTTFDWINGRTLIPDLLQRAPQVRPVLDRYGLRGCGGAHGPVESLEFFAHLHDVDVRELLDELSAAVDNQAAMDSPKASFADRVYRPFFLSGIAVVLTLGAVWGAYLLLRISADGSFRAVGIHEVNAHGHAQIFGWVGLFVMGFAMQALPRFGHTNLAAPRLAGVVLALMLTGIIGRSIAEPLADRVSGAGRAAIAFSVLEIAAIVLFVGMIVATRRKSDRPLAAADGFILTAFAWFVIQAVCESVFLVATLTATSRESLLDLVATWQAPLRDIQIHGFASLIVLGVSQRMLHHLYGFRAPGPRMALAALAIWNLAVIGESVGLVLMRVAGRSWAGLWYGSALALAAVAAALVWNWRLFLPARETDRSLKFIRMAYTWLLISLSMLALLPVYQFVMLPQLAPDSEAARIGFSHAYYGAIRHAITVGFVSLMIVGMAAKVVPTLQGLDVRSLGGLWGPFALLTSGCALRVIAQTATDFTPQAFPMAGVSGLLEVAGLTWWAAHIVRLMAGHAVAAQLRLPVE
jgi:hypothetical protein